ncbi:MAG: 7-cyano-7-deazaguanine synthase [Deltaproteobacteria bacterium]|nr:7-cyano-7-deazaguanine synthase [Deltaproteobacteria bacterium]
MNKPFKTAGLAGAVVLVSGGLDSCVTAAVATQPAGRAGFSEPVAGRLAGMAGWLAFLHANYGQRTEQRELEAFNAIADFYRVEKRLIVNLDYLKDIGGSALTDRAIEVPEGDLSRTGIPATYVPFRNAHLLAAAVSWAEVIGAVAVYIGAVEEDGSGYPDCREGFFRAFEKAAFEGTRPETDIRIIAPLIHMKKGEIVRKGVELNAPLNLTWSCYRDSAVACGTCDSCLLRLKGFREAGAIDPIPYGVRRAVT